MSASKTVVDVKDLSVQLQRENGAARPILSAVTFSLAEDQVIGIIGESGSGKTVLSRALVNWIRTRSRSLPAVFYTMDGT